MRIQPHFSKFPTSLELWIEMTATASVSQDWQRHCTGDQRQIRARTWVMTCWENINLATICTNTHAGLVLSSKTRAVGTGEDRKWKRSHHQHVPSAGRSAWASRPARIKFSPKGAALAEIRRLFGWRQNWTAVRGWESQHPGSKIKEGRKIGTEAV